MGCLFFPLHTLGAFPRTAQRSFDAIHGTNKLTDEGNLPAKKVSKTTSMLGLLHSVLLKLTLDAQVSLWQMHILSSHMQILPSKEESIKSVRLNSTLPKPPAEEKPKTLLKSWPSFGKRVNSLVGGFLSCDQGLRWQVAPVRSLKEMACLGECVQEKKSWALIWSKGLLWAITQHIKGDAERAKMTFLPCSWRLNENLTL